MSQKLRIEFFLCHIFHIDHSWSYWPNNYFYRSFCSFDHYHMFRNTIMTFIIRLGVSWYKNHDSNHHKDCIGGSIYCYSNIHIFCKSLFYFELKQVGLLILFFAWFCRWIGGHFLWIALMTYPGNSFLTFGYMSWDSLKGFYF